MGPPMGTAGEMSRWNVDKALEVGCCNYINFEGVKGFLSSFIVYRGQKRGGKEHQKLRRSFT